MALDLALIKEHPYATGAVVIVGGLVVFYILSGSQSSAGSGAQGGGPSSADYQAALASSSQIAQANAAAAAQQQAQQTQLQQAQLEAGVANTQTAAAVATNNTNTAAQLAATLAQIAASVQMNQTNADAQTAQNANQYVYAENLQEMQDQVLESQINSGVIMNANNNATALAATQVQAGLASQSIAAGLSLAQQQQSDYESNVGAILQKAGQPYNTANDANRATTLESQILAGGNPAPVITNQQVQGAQNVAADTLAGSIVNSLASVATGFFGARPSSAGAR